MLTRKRNWCNTTKHRERVQICTNGRESFHKGEFFSVKYTKLFIDFLNSSRLSFNALDEPGVRNFFQMIGFPLYRSDYYRKTALPHFLKLKNSVLMTPYLLNLFVFPLMSLLYLIYMMFWL